MNRMQPRRATVLALLLLPLLLAACGGPEVQRADTRGYLPEVVDTRAERAPASRLVVGPDVHYLFGEEYFGARLIDILHTRVTMEAPRRPQPTRVEVVEIEVGLTVTGGATVLDSIPRGTESKRYMADPGQLVIREVDPAVAYPFVARIVYLLDGQRHEARVVVSTRASELTSNARLAYEAAVEHVVERLREPVNASRSDPPHGSS